MKPGTSDTDPRIDKMLIEGYRQMSPSRKYQLIWQWFQSLEQLQIAEIRQRYPNATERECRLRAASRRIPKDLMLKAFGWDVHKEGY